jgi:hypothetical protein
MSKQDEIKRLDRDLRDAEIRKSTYFTNINALNKEIDILTTKEITLLDNLRCLKKRRVIAIASEYHKIKNELLAVKGRTVDHINSREQYSKLINDLDGFIVMTKKDLERLQHVNNVIPFRRKNE